MRFHADTERHQNFKCEKKKWIEKTGWTSDLALSNKIEHDL